jgi:hypothetical protein
MISEAKKTLLELTGRTASGRAAAAAGWASWWCRLTGGGSGGSFGVLNFFFQLTFEIMGLMGFSY